MSLEEGEQRAKELAVMFIETSAKSSYNVKQVIFIIIFIFQKQNNTIYYQMNTFGRLPEKHVTH